MDRDMQPLVEVLKRAGVARREAVPAEPAVEDCAICGGAGYLRRDVSVDDPRFGELISCECTVRELEQKRLRMLYERSQLAELQHLTFDRFILKYRGGKPPEKSPDAAYHVARQYAEDPYLGDRDRPWLLLYGPKGTGKTHLAAAIGNARLTRAEPAIFMVVPDLLDHLRAAYSPTSDITYDDLFESLRNTPLLILDDLGTQNSSPWAQEKLYQLINHRYNRRLPTVVTANSDKGDIEPRLWSRVADQHLAARCEVISKDMRLADEGPVRMRRGKVREDHQI